MHASRTRRHRMLLTAGTSLAVIGLLAACTPGSTDTSSEPTNASLEGNADTGDTVVIGFSGPAADHGWLAAINSAAIAEA